MTPEIFTRTPLPAPSEGKSLQQFSSLGLEFVLPDLTLRIALFQDL